MSPEILTIVAGVSTFLGLLSLIVYFITIFSLKREEQSLFSIIQGENVNDPGKVIDILKQFNKAHRLEALKTILNSNKERTEAFLKKIDNKIDIEKFAESSRKNTRKIFGMLAIALIGIAIIAFVWSLIQPSNHEPATKTKSPLTVNVYSRDHRVMIAKNSGSINVKFQRDTVSTLVENGIKKMVFIPDSAMHLEVNFKGYIERELDTMYSSSIDIYLTPKSSVPHPPRTQILSYSLVETYAQSGWSEETYWSEEGKSEIPATGQQFLWKSGSVSTTIPEGCLMTDKIDNRASPGTHMEWLGISASNEDRTLTQNARHMIHDQPTLLFLKVKYRKPINLTKTKNVLFTKNGLEVKGKLKNETYFANFTKEYKSFVLELKLSNGKTVTITPGAPRNAQILFRVETNNGLNSLILEPDL